MTQPRVVIVGRGFGGLYAARALAGAPVSVTLIDKRNYHLFRPLLYQVTTGLLSADEISGPLRSILVGTHVPYHKGLMMHGDFDVSCRAARRGERLCD